ncbi:hypothetical protein TNCT_313401 [Trichonephila clavata]|uniref:Uncharacterized protein n=1 Tax=Trichonephila clavata TaxID=2740835 RepID=A0A8X6HAC7_TRICU|nr:hypothetical protein TNCT_313401 [Trichonephila clavata]
MRIQSNFSINLPLVAGQRERICFHSVDLRWISHILREGPDRSHCTPSKRTGLANSEVNGLPSNNLLPHGEGWQKMNRWRSFAAP